MDCNYDDVGSETATMRFAQAAMKPPVDAQEVDLRQYRGLRAPYQDLNLVLQRVRAVALPALEEELRAAPRSDVPQSLLREPPAGGRGGTRA